MKILSALASSASGSLGGMTASRNRGGQYLRRRVTPTNPNTTLQQTRKADFSTVAIAWRNSLDASARAAWADYAAQVPVIDTLGQTRYLTGFQWYLATVTQYLLAGGSTAEPAPTIFNRYPPVISVNSFVVNSDAEIEADSEILGDGWGLSSTVLVYVSRPVNPTINFFKGPFQFVTAIEVTNLNYASGVLTLAAATPLPFALAVGQRVFFRFVALGASPDTRTSPETIIPATVVAPTP